MSRALVLAALPILLVAACSRAPEEPVRPDPRVTPNAGAASASPVPRCIRATPDAPPPAAKPAPPSLCPADPAPPNNPPTVRLQFTGAPLDAEIAKSAAETERGLMYRTQMDANHGMIFVMGSREEHTFWMHNTCIPLDMLFVDDDGTIVGILENVPTLNDEPRTVGCPSSYVIETNAGWCRSHGVKAGQKVVLPKL